MSILKDEVLEKKKEKSLKVMLEKLKAKKNVRVFLNEEAKENYEKKESILNKYSAMPVVEGGNDTYDLIMDDYLAYRKMLVIANILKAKGLANELSVQGGMIFSTDDKVQEIISRLAEQIENPNVSVAAFETETKAIIFSTDIDERTNLNTSLDRDRNGVIDSVEDMNDNGVKDTEEKIYIDWEKHVADYQRDVAIDNDRQARDAEYRRSCIEKREQNAKEREAEEKKHGRKFGSLLDAE